MSTANQALSGNALTPLLRSSINSPLGTTLLLDSDIANSSLLLQTGGINSLYIDQYANVGINTTSPGTQLEIASANGACLRLRYGATANFSSLFMDSSGNLSINPSGTEVSTNQNFNISAHNGTTIGLKLGGTLVTATAIELNYVDVVAGTATASKALVLDASLNITGINSISTTTLLLGGVSLGATQAGYLTGITAGTALASKALILNASSAIAGIAAISSTGAFTNTLTTASTSNITGALILSGGIAISNATDATSVTNGGTITTAGGAAIAKTLFVGTAFAVGGTAISAAAWGANGIRTRHITAIYTNTSTAAAGTVALSTFTSFDQPTLAATNTGVITTNAATVYIAGGPVAGTNQTITNSYALYIAAGSAFFGGGITLTGSLSGITTINSSGAFTNTLVTSSTSNTTGALILSGGIGLSNTTDATSTTNGGTITTAGGVAIAKTLFVGTAYAVGGTAISAAAWGANGIRTRHIAATYTNTSTAAAGTVALATFASFAQPTLAATNTGVITTNAATVYIAGGPINGTNQTITNAYALQIATGNSLFGGAINSTLATASTSNITGALILSGGIGLSNTTDATSTTNGGTITTAGGVAIAKTLFVGTAYSVGGTAISAAAWGVNGIRTRHISATYTDTSTAAAGTAALATFASFAQPTLAATNTTVTTTVASTVYIANAPIAGLNQTIANAYALQIAAGNSLFGGAINSTLATASTSNITGSLILTGGIGISNATDAISITNGGTITTAGGAAIAKTLFVGTAFAVGGTAISAAAWGANGIRTRHIAATYTDTSTAAAGTAALATFASFAQPTLAATNTGVITTNASTIYIANAPVAGTNQTITNAYALHVAAGNVLINAATVSVSFTSGALVVTGGVGIGGALNINGNTATNGTINVLSTTDATSTVSGGTFTTAGGAAIGKTLFIGTAYSVGGTAISAAAWGVNGIRTRHIAATYTDTSTAAAGTAALATFASFAQPTLASTNTGVTTTVASTLYIANAPVAGTNQTIGTAYALHVAAGRTLLNGLVGIGTANTSGYIMEVGFNTQTIAVSYGFLTSAGSTGSAANSGAQNFSAKFNGRINVAGEIDVVSDRRIKEDIIDITPDEAMEFVENVNPIYYKLKADHSSAYGYIAQDLIKHNCDKLIQIQNQPGLEETIDDDGFVSPADMLFSVNYQKVSVLLHKYIQLQNVKIKELERENLNLNTVSETNTRIILDLQTRLTALEIDYRNKKK
jgi:hypothetical protein